MTVGASRSRFVTSFVVGSRYMPAYLALVLFLIVASIWAPSVLSSVALSAIAPTAALLAIASLGQMLVIMTGGIDLSIPGTFSLAALIMVGVGDRSDERVLIALATALGAGLVIGLVNGLLIGGLKLNALIVTLAMGQVVLGVVNRYVKGIPVSSPVPEAWTEWVTTRIFGVSPMFWLGVALTILLMIGFRFSMVGRRFQVVGANPVASHVVGVRVNLNQISAYVVASMLYALAGAILAGSIRIPGPAVGNDYLLGPIAAVVIGGASLTGGLASPMATFVAALFLTGLNQMLLTLRQPTAIRFVVFGLVIIGGMLVSGDRITKGVERLLRERRRGRPPDIETTDLLMRNTG